MLLVDACVQKDALGTDGDYFVIEEAEAGGRAAAAALRRYIDGTGVTIRGEIIAVCAARLNTNSQTVRAADRAGGRVRDAVPPLKLPASIAGDAEYVSALQLISTYSFERAAVPAKKDNIHTNHGPTRISMAEFQRAAKVLKDRTGASSVLFLGVLGKSRTGGKALAQFLGAMTVGIGTAYATAGLGTGVYVMFVPGSQVSGSMLEGALIDLDSGELAWSKAVGSIGNPVKPQTLANPEALDMLFRDVMFKPALVPPRDPLKK